MSAFGQDVDAVTLHAVDPLDRGQDRLTQGWHRVYQRALQETYGSTAAGWSQEEVRVQFTHQEYERRAAWAAVRDDAVVGHAQLILFVADNTHFAKLHVAVDPAYRRRGIGSALLRVLEDAARAAGRTVLVGHSDVLFGHDDPAAGFAESAGYARGQANLRSDLLLPPRRDLEAELGASSADYELLTSWGEIPGDWLEQRARLAAHMSTAAPRGDVDVQEERWNVERARRVRRTMLDQGRQVVETVARQRQSGLLAGYTTLVVPAGRPELSLQWDTFVLSEHRGHRLGLHLKVANLLALHHALPAVERVVTWNAAENEPMRRVNRAMGFVPVGHHTEWQKAFT
ncbi:GNAT family N-acetyltransferase [Streptomyces fuscichromogenes]|uniref:GNAT family N-acetyltransferase n=1 Tax=Streptomyces fuscichromogenes TaxID=1324013 RepID=A0A917XGF8_9ACTN|nr:GNAT family N-acetyltransferase [Streptomyces fuscichromogenes]GGN22758.1 GNAT family N-acetyltransferase [Streptomyces fuscichromogenes]